MNRERVLTGTKPEVNGLSDYSISTLAWIGDAVFELRVRERLARDSTAPSGTLHRQATRFVCAKGQAACAHFLQEEDGDFPLEEDERTLLRRARNFHSNSTAKNADLPAYRMATAFEALIGWLWLAGKQERAALLMDHALDQIG